MRARRVLAFLVAAGCYTQPSQPPPRAWPQQAQAAPGVEEWQCTVIETAQTRGSLCFADRRRCEAERQAAEADGARTAACQPQSPVACFQLGGDPSPSMEMCASSEADCDLWRLIDQDKNGQTGGACEWRHGPGVGMPG